MNDESRANIMFIVPCFGFGGLERVILSLVEAIDRKQFNPSFCSLLNPDPEMFECLKKLDIRCHILDKGHGLNAMIPFRLAKILKRERIDLINSHDIGATLYAAPAALIAGKKALIHTDHSQILTKKRYLPLYRIVLNNMVTHSITVSIDLERYLVKNFGLRMDRVTTIPNSVDVGRFEIEKDVEPLRRELNIDDHDIVIGVIGRLTKQKGIGFLIRAFKTIALRYPKARLILVGEGDLRGNLELLANQLGVLNRIVFTGIRKDIPELFNLFDIFVLPSLWEGQPITLMEAMAAGKPIVATAVGGNDEILNGGVFGHVVPPMDHNALAESIMMFIGDKEYAKQVASRGKQYALKHFSIMAMVKRHEAVFMSVLTNMPALQGRFRVQQ